jgi:signal transduction histidine kinase
LKTDETGKTIGILHIHNDISATKEAEQRVSEFYSTISHELRTPLTSMKGVFSILTGGRAGDLSERAKSLVIMGSNETERLIRLINNILDMKKIEAGKLELFLEILEPKKIIEETVATVASFATQYKVDLAIEIHQNDLIKGDRDRLTQILTNLISNAVKFSDEGQTVTVLADRKNDFIRFSVVDRGPGIAPRNLPKLFRMFQQVKSDNHVKGGTGLGLAICKSMVEQHGGTIGIDTEEGKGSTFWFEIPCASVPKAESGKMASLKLP